MDLAGHDRFSRSSASQADLAQMGESLLAAGWAALASARAESIDIHLRHGPVITGVLAVRIDARLAEAATTCTVSGQLVWTHMFAVEDARMVQFTPRGGRRT